MALLLRPFRLFLNGQKPLSVLTRASVSDTVKARLDQGDTRP